MTNAQHTPIWQIDECEDANGFFTIRAFDGSPNGNTDEQPIATVYERGNAEAIVRAAAEADLLGEALEMVRSLEQSMAAILESDTRRAGPAALIPEWLSEIRALLTKAKKQ